MIFKPTCPFNIDTAQAAVDAWNFNCGPAALAAIMGLSPNEVRPHMGDFEKKGYTNPTLMYQALRSVGAEFQDVESWPKWGLARVQWEGPWTMPGVPIRARYRHTHWVGCAGGRGELPPQWIFDINCMCDGGWEPYDVWANEVVPWLIRECAPRADGKWHLTHRIEITERD